MTISIVPPAARAAKSAQWVAVKVRYYETPIQAAPDRAVLEEAGIPTTLLDGEMIGMEWQMHRALGGTKLVVPAGELERATELLGSALVEGAGGAPDWVTPDEAAATRLQNLALISLLFGIITLPFYCYLLFDFMRRYSGRSAAATRRLRRSVAVAFLASLLVGAWAIIVVEGILDG